MSNTDKIYKAIQDGNETTKEIVEVTGLTPSVVRRGLAKLRKEEPVQAIKVGNTWHHAPLGAILRESEEELAKTTVVLKVASVGRSCPVSVGGGNLGSKMDELLVSSSSLTKFLTARSKTIVKPGEGVITIRSTTGKQEFRRVTRLEAQGACDSGGGWTITSKTAWRRWKKTQG